ncbi:MAG: DnaA/Hda family protein, partial [Paracoccaceae bacterium]
MTIESWAVLQTELLQRVGKNNYTTWIEPLSLTSLESGVARFDVPTVFFGDWVSRNFSDTIRQLLSQSGHVVQRLEFNVSTQSKSSEVRRVVSKKPRDSTDEEAPSAPNSILDARFTFDSFIVGKPNELAHAAARRVAEGGPVSFNPLFLYGGVGLGKTHLMHAIAHELSQRRPELRVLYLSAEQFMYRFVQALRERQIMDFKELFRSVDVLMVDDVQFIAGKDSTQEEFFHTFNALVDQ